jgi:8-oxo-dGTP diphosphatase
MLTWEVCALVSREYPNRPIVGIGAVVMGPQGILLVERGKPPRQGEWSIPGGAQELGETIEQAAVREIAEETGLGIEVLGLIDVVDSLARDERGDVRYHYTLVDVLAAVTGGELRAGGDAANACWFALDDLAGLDLWSETSRIIDLATEMYEALEVTSA